MEFGLLDFLIAYAIREMYHYTVDTSDTQMYIGTYLIHSRLSVDLNKGIDRYSIISSDLKCGQLTISDHSVCSCTADLCSFTELS